MNHQTNALPTGWTPAPEAAAEAGDGWVAGTLNGTQLLTNVGLYNDGQGPEPVPPPEEA